MAVPWSVWVKKQLITAPAVYTKSVVEPRILSALDDEATGDQLLLSLPLFRLLLGARLLSSVVPRRTSPLSTEMTLARV